MPPDWARVNEIFHRALEHPASARPAFLDSACGGDEALRREVASLLAAGDRAGDFIERPAVSPDPMAPAARTPDALVGQDVGHYRVQRILGQGGMGIVYLAEDTRLGRAVALKALAPRFTRDPGRRTRLAREARAAGGLAHPGIATVFALETFDDHLYIVSEYVPGETLRAEIARGPISPARAIDTAIALTRALAAAHERGVVHRDLKPENIIRTPAGQVKILDFGLARFRDPQPDAAALTGDGMILGTPAYMSPEQIRGGTVDFRSDLFSLGIIVYELATGANPFAGRDAASAIASILETEPAPFSQHVPDHDAANGAAAQLEAIVMTCVRKPEDARYGSTHDLLAALERARAALADSGLAGRAASSRATSAPLAGTMTGPRWWWEFHQAAASIADAVLLVPLWMVHEWAPGLAGLVLFLAALSAAIAAGTLRMHMLFTVKSYPAEWGEQDRRTRPWVRLADLGFAVVLLAGAALVLTRHASIAAILVGSAVAVVVSSTVIEPATTRAAFGSR